MSSVHQFISALKDQQSSARYEMKANGRVIANLVATVGGSSLLTAANECVIPEALGLLPGATVLSLGAMKASERNRSGRDHNICIFVPSKDTNTRGDILTIAYGQPCPDAQYEEQVKSYEAGTANAVVLFSGHFVKSSPLGQEWQIQYLTDNGEVLIQLLAW